MATDGDVVLLRKSCDEVALCEIKDPFQSKNTFKQGLNSGHTSSSCHLLLLARCVSFSMHSQL
jgi:hypothetical protein